MTSAAILVIVALVYLACGVGAFMFGEHVARQVGEADDPATPLGFCLIVAVWPVFMAIVVAEIAKNRRDRR